MQILVLGGTQFVGRHITEGLVAAGHAVSVLNRGLTPDALPAAVERLRGDRDAGPAGLRALAAGLSLTPPAATVTAVRGWLPQTKLTPALSPERERWLLDLARGGHTAVRLPWKPNGCC